MSSQRVDCISPWIRNFNYFIYHLPKEGESSDEERIINNVIVLRKFLSNDLAFVLLLDQAKQEITAYFSLKDETPCRKMTWSVGDRVKDLFSGPAEDWERELNQLLSGMLNKRLFNSILVRPVSASMEEHTALLGVASFAPRNYTNDHLLMLDTIARNISFCWDNKKITASYHMLDQEMDALKYFSKYLSTCDGELGNVLDSILDELKTITRIDDCGIFLYDARQKALVLQNPSFRYAKGEQKTFAIPVEDEYARFFAAGSSLTVPLVVDNRRIGVLHVVNKENGKFTAVDVRLWELLAWQLANFIENNRLFVKVSNSNILLKNTMDVHKELGRQLLRGRSLDQIIAALAHLLERDVIVQDHYFQVLGSFFFRDDEELKTLEEAMNDAIRSKNTFRKIIEQINSSKEPRFLHSFPRYKLERCRLVAPMTLGESVTGYVSILEDEERKLGEMDYLAIEHAVTVFTLKVMQDKVARDLEEWSRGDFLDDLISGNYRSEEEIKQKASNLGCKLAEPYQVMFFNLNQVSFAQDLQNSNDHHFSLKRHVFDLVSKFLKEKIPESIVGTKSEAIIAVALPGKREISIKEVAVLIREKIKELYPEANITVGLGRPVKTIDDIRVSYQEARRAVLINRELERGEQINSYDSLGAYKILFNVNDLGELQYFMDQTLGVVLEHDRDKKKDTLLSTLKCYLLCNCNNQKTADQLNIHLNTLKYRLHKIEELTGKDLNDPETRLNFQLALKIQEIKSI